MNLHRQKISALKKNFNQFCAKAKAIIDSSQVINESVLNRNRRRRKRKQLKVIKRGKKFQVQLTVRDLISHCSEVNAHNDRLNDSLVKS